MVKNLLSWGEPAGDGARNVVAQPLVELLVILIAVVTTTLAHGLRAEPLSLGEFTLIQPDVSEWIAPPEYLRAPFEPRIGREPARRSPDPGVSTNTSMAAVANATARFDGSSVALPRAQTAPSEAAAHGAGDGSNTAVPERILMLGDSMIEPLQQRAADYFHQAGHKFISVVWYGSRTVDWGGTDRLSAVLQTYAPSYVIVVLGSNELTVRDVKRRAVRVRAMLQTLGTLPVVWVGPPNWRADTGLNAMLEAELGSHYFRSEGLEFERKSDGIHPTDASGAVWMDRVAEWLGMRADETRLQLNPPTGKGRYHAPAKVWPPPSR